VSATATEEQSTSFWDMIPGIAQGKSLIQLIFGDKEGAAKTQEHFLNEGVGSSQLRSGYFLVTGEPKKALDIQKKFFSNLEGILDGTPIIGHVKGGIHLLAGDHDQGWQALKSATSTSGALVGAVIGGPAGAIGGHFLTDALISGTDAILNGNQSQPHGLVDYLLKIDKLKPGEHFDVIAGLVLDTTAGKKVKTTRDKFNTGRFRSEQSKENHEVQPLLENEQLDNPGIIESSRESNKIIEKEQQVNEPGPSKNTYDSSQVKEKLEKLNMLKMLNFYYFLRKDPTYYDFGLHKLWTGEAELESAMKIHFDELDNFKYNFILEDLDTDSLKNKLSYLTDDEKSLIDKYDFRTINTEGSSTNCLACSIAAILKLNLETARRYIRENLESNQPYGEFKMKTCLESLKKRKLIEYTSSHELNSLQDIDMYLKSNARELENKHLLLEEHVINDKTRGYDYTQPGHVAVMKFKIDKNNLEPVKLIIDYQYPGFLQPDVPNPLRFQSYVDTTVYKHFYVYDVEAVK